MAGSVNKVILIGNIGQDPEVRTMQSGDKVCSFSVATSESWRDKASGERKEKTEWHNISIFNQNLVTIAEKYLKKGSKVYLEGQLETRKYTDKNGIEKYATDVVLRPYRGELTLLDSRSSSGEGYGAGSTYDTESSDSPDRTKAAISQRSVPSHALDDDIPF